jgi:hypothetical protein
MGVPPLLGRTPNAADNGRFLVFKSNPAAHWLDDYEEAQGIAREGEKTMRAAAAYGEFRSTGCGGR